MFCWSFIVTVTLSTELQCFLVCLSEGDVECGCQFATMTLTVEAINDLWSLFMFVGLCVNANKMTKSGAQNTRAANTQQQVFLVVCVQIFLFC